MEIHYLFSATYYQPKPVIHAAPPVALSVPPPPIPPPPPPSIPQTPPVIQQQGGYASAVPTYPVSAPLTAGTAHPPVSYTHPYSNATQHKYPAYTRNR